MHMPVRIAKSQAGYRADCNSVEANTHHTINTELEQSTLANHSATEAFQFNFCGKQPLILYRELRANAIGFLDNTDSTESSTVNSVNLSVPHSTQTGMD